MVRRGPLMGSGLGEGFELFDRQVEKGKNVDVRWEGALSASEDRISSCVWTQILEKHEDFESQPNSHRIIDLSQPSLGFAYAQFCISGESRTVSYLRSGKEIK